MNTEKGGNKDILKKKNRGLLLKLISTRQCSSRVELAKVMGLSKMAISNMVSELISLGLIEEYRIDSKDEIGRTPIGLKISSDTPKIIGVLIARDHCEAILSDMNLNIYKREKLTMESASNETLVEMIYELVDTMISECSEIMAIGIASIGPIDAQHGIILEPQLFYGIKNVPIVEKLQDKYHLPVFMENDNSCGILVEKYYGVAQNCKDVMLLGISQGVGCGIIINGELYDNNLGLVPEFGHISIDYNGRKCVCGNNGCIETYISTPVLLKQLREATGKYYSFKTFCELDDIPIVNEILTDAILKLSAAITNLVNILNSELIILSYDSTYFSDKLIKFLENEVNAHKYSSRPNISIKRPHFAQDAQLLGSVCLINQRIFSGELLL